jgi:hypothetical protein
LIFLRKVATRIVGAVQEEGPVEQVENDESTRDANAADGFQNVNAAFGGVAPAVWTVRAEAARETTLRRVGCRRFACRLTSKLQKSNYQNHT